MIFFSLSIGTSMYIARPDAPAEVHKAVERRQKDVSSSSLDPKLIVWFSIVPAYWVVFGDRIKDNPMARYAFAALFAGLLIGLMARTIVAPSRNIRKLSGYVKQGYVVEVPDQLWARYVEICKQHSIEPALGAFSSNIPLLTAQVMPAYSRACEATGDVQTHLQKFVDTKLTEIATGSASLASRSEREELEAVQTEFPVDNDHLEDPKSFN